MYEHHMCASILDEFRCVRHDGCHIVSVVFIGAANQLCCTNGVRDSLSESSWVATVHEQLVPYAVHDQELALVHHGAEAARFSINLV